MEQKASKRGKKAEMLVPAGLAAVWRPMLEMVRLHLRLHPGHAQARQLVVQAKVALERSLSVDEAGYELVRLLAEILDKDNIAVAAGRGAVVPAARDPIAAMVQAGRLGAEGLRAAREIVQVAEMMRDGGVIGLRAMDTTAIRVDGGGGSPDMLTRTGLHPAVGLVAEWLTDLDAAGQVWPDRDGRFWRHSEVLLAVVVDRISCSEMERALCVRNGQVGKAVRAGLEAYADAAAQAWVRSDRVLSEMAKQIGEGC